MKHIVTLPSLTVVARRKILKLSIITFVDATRAYDNVRTDTLFYVLKRFGCGTVVLHAIVAMYKLTYCIVCTASVTASIGVRQGGSTSCLLFVIFVSDLITLMKQSC